MDKSKQIWFRYKNDQKKLKLDCVDVIGHSFRLLGQKPDATQIKLMASVLFDTLVNSAKYSVFTMDDVISIFQKGLKGEYNTKESESTSVFINIRTMNIWLKEGKKEVAAETIRLNLLKEKKYIEAGKHLGNTINKAKQIGNNK